MRRFDVSSSHWAVRGLACTEHQLHHRLTDSILSVRRISHARTWWNRSSLRRKSIHIQYKLTVALSNSDPSILIHTFCLPGNLNFERLKASMQAALFESLARTDMSGWPMLTRATVPNGLPKAPLIPVCRRSAPAHDNILLIRMTWNGCTRILMWKASLPMVLTRYLLAQIRAASRASDESCSYSSETKWTQSGKSSTFALLRPKSKILIFGSIVKQKIQNFICI